jgi:hypothetical protein
MKKSNLFLTGAAFGITAITAAPEISKFLPSSEKFPIVQEVVSSNNKLRHELSGAIRDRLTSTKKGVGAIGELLEDSGDQAKKSDSAKAIKEGQSLENFGRLLQGKESKDEILTPAQKEAFIKKFITQFGPETPIQGKDYFLTSQREAMKRYIIEENYSPEVMVLSQNPSDLLKNSRVQIILKDILSK